MVPETFFFEIRVLLPNDFNEDIERFPEDCIDEIFSAPVYLPDSSDMNPTLIDNPYVTVAGRIVTAIRLEWAYRVGKDFLDFYQLERTENGHHLHVLLETKDVKGFVLGRFLPSFRERIQNRVYSGCHVLIPDWFKPRKNKNVGGANRTVNRGYIYNYLLPKRQSELQWAWSNIEALQSALLNISERERLVKEYLAQLKPVLDEREASGENHPRIGGKNSERYMALVQWLVEQGITSEKQWIQENQDSYVSYNTSSTSRSQIKAALDNASKIMMLTKSAKDYLIGPSPPTCLEENRLYKIFKMNGYDPALAGSILIGWFQKKFGKRNAVWLYGPATTGKTNIAEAIAHAVPYYGCVNWTNENFPFNDCVDKMLIWWEEGKMTAKIVESAKAILGGSKVRVDQKCKASQQIDSTPVIITSNTDMTVVVDGNITTMEHREPLEDRMFQFYLGRRLPDDFGKITKQEVREFFKWAELNQVEVTPCFRVPVRDLKRKRQPEVESVAAETPEETDAPHAAAGTVSDQEPDRGTVFLPAENYEEPAKKVRAEPRETHGGPKQSLMEAYLQTLEANTPPSVGPIEVHDHSDVRCGHGKALFCDECDFIKKVECPDSNKEQ
uniref:Replication protein n=2 Tax=Parvoviridae TaxID=10780 RepID=A0A6M9Z8E3_9VIRU|nr:MAG: replication protein [Parvoviridae sp.]QKN88778.1 MAG: replication protein [Dependoparvovirus sp.]